MTRERKRERSSEREGVAATPGYQAGVAGVREGGTVHFERMIQRGYSLVGDGVQ